MRAAGLGESQWFPEPPEGLGRVGHSLERSASLRATLPHPGFFYL